MDKPKYEMRINLNVLNHLGLNLYSNFPAVLSEVVANSWDADAENVDIKIEKDRITITDDGHGMSEVDINTKYLNVGYERRKNEPVRTSKHDRPVMGRKGIGKLSLFSIANIVEIQTVKAGKKRGFVMSTAAIRAVVNQNDESSYYPDALPESHIEHDKTGTRIVLTGLKKGVSHAPNALRKRLARRFSVIGTPDFNVTINGKPVTVTDRDYFHKVQYLWYYGAESEKYRELCDLEKPEDAIERPGTIKVGMGEDDSETVNYDISGWLGTVRKSGDLSDRGGDENLNKIVIMVRGKLAQEDILSDFTECRLYTKYLIGEIHADFLDLDNEADIATSNRQEIIKDDPRYQALRNWVRDELKNIEGQWTALRAQKAKEEALQIPAIHDWLQGLNHRTRKQAEALFGKIGKLTIAPKDRIEFYKHSVLAFESLRYKGSLDKLEQVSAENLKTFTRIFADLDDIEASLYYQIVQERLKVIEKLHKHVADDAKEKVIQKYLYDHLWLLDPSWDRATETPLMEQNVQKEFDNLDAGLTKEEKEGRFDIKYKMTSGKHVIIELKRANRVLNHYELLDQVEKYGEALRKLVWALGKHEPVEIVCIVGKPLRQWENPEQRERSKNMMAEQSVRVVLYDELIEDAYRSYKEFLAKNREAGRVYRLIQNIEDEVQKAFAAD